MKMSLRSTSALASGLRSEYSSLPGLTLAESDDKFVERCTRNPPIPVLLVAHPLISFIGLRMTMGTGLAYIAETGQYFGLLILSLPLRVLSTSTVILDLSNCLAGCAVLSGLKPSVPESSHPSSTHIVHNCQFCVPYLPSLWRIIPRLASAKTIAYCDPLRINVMFRSLGSFQERTYEGLGVMRRARWTLPFSALRGSFHCFRLATESNGRNSIQTTLSLLQPFQFFPSPLSEVFLFYRRN
ncbi:hypothetical protein K439DRAFT_995229 [Ramaria rubella]|nr:hypothetical protein K439DRAFT_995229 [Ramaria rubella]